MFDSLSNKVLDPKGKKIKSSTVSKVPNTGDKYQKDHENTQPDIKDIVLNLPNFELQPIPQEFDTIDNSLLANLLYDIPNKNNDDESAIETVQNQGMPPPPLPLQPIQNPTQFLQNVPQNQINVHNVQNQRIPIMPHLYYPTQM